MIATITANGQGRCMWCCSDADVLTVEFRDGLRGQLCWPDFKKALKDRSGVDDKPAPKPKPADPKAS